MSETIEQAQEGIEHAHHASEHGGGEHGAAHGAANATARNVAVLIAVLAACLALTEMGEKAAQSSYLTHHISVSDTYAFAQAKNIRRTDDLNAADIIDSLPNLDDAGRARATKLRGEAARMIDDPKTGEGSRQLLEKAAAQAHDRDHAFHIYHQFELATGALQIAIVLASVSIVTRVRMLTFAAAIIGGTAAVYGALVATGIV